MPSGARKGTKKDTKNGPSGSPSKSRAIKCELGNPGASVKVEDEEDKPSKDASTMSSFPYVESLPKSETAGSQKSQSKQKKRSTSTPFAAADLERYLFPAIHDSESETSFQAHLDRSAQQLKTEKQVRFFRDNIHDKHFIDIPIEPLLGTENWREWLVSIQLLFVQHGLWDVVSRGVKPLPATHPLHLWYQRMRDCGVALIFANVSDEVRKQDCFLAAAIQNDPDILMDHLFTHYGEPNEISPDAGSAAH